MGQLTKLIFSSTCSDRTKTHFISSIATRLLHCDPVHYSGKRKLDCDFLVLAAALRHKIPDRIVDLTKVLADYKRKANYMKERHNDDIPPIVKGKLKLEIKFIKPNLFLN